MRNGECRIILQMVVLLSNFPGASTVGMNQIQSTFMPHLSNRSAQFPCIKTELITGTSYLLLLIFVVVFFFGRPTYLLCCRCYWLGLGGIGGGTAVCARAAAAVGFMAPMTAIRLATIAMVSCWCCCIAAC
jgi:hypothetical protein